MQDNHTKDLISVKHVLGDITIDSPVFANAQRAVSQHIQSSVLREDYELFSTYLQQLYDMNPSAITVALQKELGLELFFGCSLVFLLLVNLGS